MQVQEKLIGQPTRRVDGVAKVTGSAQYAAEYDAPGLLHGCVVSGSIAKGRIVSIDTSAALALPGVIEVFTHLNRPVGSDWSADYGDMIAPPGEPFRPLGNERILFNGQPVALVVADHLEAARDAAALLEIAYAAEPHCTDLDEASRRAYKPPKKRMGIAPPPKPRGDFGNAFADAPVKFEAEYRTAIEHHNPMEPFATTCIWQKDGFIEVHDKTQGSQNVRGYLAHALQIPKRKVRVLNRFVGGAFGSGLRPQYQVFLAAMASLALERSVRVVLTRDQMFTLSYRPQTIQTVTLGAEQSGQLTAIGHRAVANTSSFEDHQEVVVNWSTLLYSAPNTRSRYELAALDAFTPSDMRAPGAPIGVFAIESAIDELAHRLRIDPIELRLRNYTERIEDGHKKFTSKSLARCFERGAEAFGWADRDPEPRSMRDERELVGWGMAAGVWDAMMVPARARAALDRDGHLTVSAAATDIGTGTYTVMAQTGADALGLPIDRVTAELGDSRLPFTLVEGGSFTAASTCSAVLKACEKLKEKLVFAAYKVPGRPLGRASPDDVRFNAGRIERADDPSIGVTLAEVMAAADTARCEATATAIPDVLSMLTHAGYTHSAVFCEVRVDEDLGMVRVTRLTTVASGGRILNPKTARSQILGGMVMGIGAALHEESVLDHRLGKFMNHNLAEYHVPAHADIEDMQVIFIEEHDTKVSPIGVKGLGELGIVGTNAAIANAIFHATGRRVRELPITIEKVLGLD